MSEPRGAGRPGLAHLLPRGARVGGRPASPPVSRLGASSLHCVCLSFPGAPLPGGGRACLGDPSPQNPPSVCLFAVCSNLGVLTLVLTVNVPRSVLCVPPDTHTYLCLLLPFAAPRVWPIAPPNAAAINTRINTHGSHSTWGPCPLWARALWLRPRTDVPTSGDITYLFEPLLVNGTLARTTMVTGHKSATQTTVSHGQDRENLCTGESEPPGGRQAWLDPGVHSLVASFSGKSLRWYEDGHSGLQAYDVASVMTPSAAENRIPVGRAKVIRDFCCSYNKSFGHSPGLAQRLGNTRQSVGVSGASPAVPSGVRTARPSAVHCIPTGWHLKQETGTGASPYVLIFLSPQ